MSARVILALLEEAPDEEMARLLMLSAVFSGVDGGSLHASWRRFVARHTAAVMRGEVPA